MLTHRLTLVVLFVAASTLRTSWAAAEETPSPSASPSTLRVAAVQMRSTRSLADNLAAIEQQLATCAAVGVRVVLFPECAATGYFDDEYMRSITAEQLADAERRLSEACREHEVYAIVGMPCREGAKLYNSAVVFDPKGRVIERYHKLQLAETWPDEGDHLSIFPIDGVWCSIIVCHDERYPELVRLPVLAGARVVFYMSHESGLHHERKLEPYRAQIQARAVENSVFVVQANAPANRDLSGSHGQSRIIAPDGNILHEAGYFGDDVLTASIDPGDATGQMARRSIERGPLGDWWRAGLEQVRRIEPDASESAR